MPQIYVELVSVNCSCTVCGYLQLLSHWTHAVKVCMNICILCVCVCMCARACVVRAVVFTCHKTYEIYFGNFILYRNDETFNFIYVHAYCLNCLKVAFSDKRRVKAAIFLSLRFLSVQNNSLHVSMSILCILKCYAHETLFRRFCEISKSDY
jgi:hypothetical protein